MSNTTNTTVKEADGWKAIKTGPSSGVFSCGSSYTFCQSDTPPADNFIGHRVSSADLIVYSLNTETLYVKCNSGIVVLTED